MGALRILATSGLLKGTRDDVRMVARGWRWGRRPLVPRSAEPFVPPRQSQPFPTAWARSPVAGLAREGVQRFGLAPLLRRTVEPRVHGLDVLERVTGPVVFVANHASHLDTPLILCSLPDSWRRRTAVAAAADYFFDTWWRATGSALAFNTFPLERRGGAPSSAPADLLADGWSVVVFPEGTRSPDGWARRFRLGAAYLAVDAGVPVVPVAIRGSFAAMPRGRSWPVAGRQPVTVRFGDPVRHQAGEDRRDLAQRVEAAVGRLLDEDATTWWEATRRAASGSTPSLRGPEMAPWRRVWASTEPPVVARHRRVWSR